MYLCVLAVCAFVLMPLFRSKGVRVNRVTGSAKSEELLFQRGLVEDTIRDLEFDFQTGKLSEQDHAALVAEQQRVLDNLDRKMTGILGVDGKTMRDNLLNEIAKEIRIKAK